MAEYPHLKNQMVPSPEQIIGAQEYLFVEHIIGAQEIFICTNKSSQKEVSDGRNLVSCNRSNNQLRW